MSTAPTAPARPSATAPEHHVVVVRPLVEADLAASSALHALTPPSAALDVPAALGAGFLRAWHLAHLSPPHAVALVAEQVDDDDAATRGARPRIAGVLLGVLDGSAHREHLLREWGPRLIGAAVSAVPSRGALRALPGVLRHHGGPVVQAVTLLPTRGGTAARVRRAETAARAGQRSAVLEALVVEPSLRGAGVGSQLLGALAAHAAGAGLDRVEARVPWGTGVEGFFTACGWTASTTRPGPRGGFETRVHRDL
ncbi:GNAT family N-acetyltransferase [Quadrisphaera oryzae]|uniref:GNAT family N-acetyltransferase n=1 Tax=Quadrisphaera TaxID=317661 RepID=UPI0016444D55|nr:GNAT family N-acetyltransferase [Quadrisphaera sp. RL12-1S]